MQKLQLPSGLTGILVSARPIPPVSATSNFLPMTMRPFIKPFPQICRSLPILLFSLTNKMHAKTILSCLTGCMQNSTTVQAAYFLGQLGSWRNERVSDPGEGSRRCAGGLPIHIHTLQTPIQRAYGMKKFGKSLLMHLDDLGLVDEHLTLGHAVYVDEADIELLARKHHPLPITRHAIFPCVMGSPLFITCKRPGSM